MIENEVKAAHMLERLGSISSTFYEQIFTRADPRSTKNTDSLTVFYAHWDLQA